MSNPNTVTIWSPNGEPFEMSRVNARDLLNHAKWSSTPPEGAAPAKAVEVATEEDTSNGSADSERSVEDADEAGTEAEAGEGEAAEAGEAEVTAPFTTEEQFAALTERDDVVAYLAKHFPDFKPHHKSSRDGLVAKAIELAAGE
jgi:hypothetical protein